ncbi:MAG: ExbD/TolR family protein [Syntrophobacteraceae bacterium]|jgi:biopolymer transport protein ExbD
MLAHFKPRPKAEVMLPMTSLIDIVFLLLIYFLLTTNFMVDEAIDLKLPQARSGAAQLQEQIIIFVSQDGRIIIGQEEIAPDALYTRIKNAVAGRKDAQVVIKADRRVVLNQAVKVMDMAKAAGASELFLATEKDL